MQTKEIEELIPHRAPMLLVDEIVSMDESTIHCRKTFHADEFFLQGHFPGFPIVPGVIQCECCLQAGAILLSQLASRDENTVPVATRMDSVKFKQLIRPGDTIDIHATLKEVISNAYFLSAKLTVDGRLATRLDFACSVAHTADLQGG